ncbi:hypothetical protein VVD49_19445 [Uliginosibacterium sp. H3]|uniref:Outer membrane protein beta-barrel domain-containing protein n=1 Tax=Uliginosibacterium silvisoli TaxID=3114758 RepID=A0ABU6K7S6_9RHOO|nr:hypothetical protein [Uliginosibacterium sp. H3]
MTKFVLAATLAGSLCMTSLPAAAQAATSGGPTYSITPYLWLPNVNGKLKYDLPSNPGGSSSSDVDVGPNSYLSNLTMLVMLAGEIRYEDWLLASDLVNLDFSSEKSHVSAAEFGGRRISIDTSSNVQTQTKLRGTVWSLVGGRTVVKKELGTLDAFGGFRYGGIKASSDWQLSAAINGPRTGESFAASGNVSESVTLWDAIVGVKGRLKLAERWSIPYYVDAGTGSSNLTWQAMLGVAYGFKWGELGLTYRHLSYDQGEDKLLQNFRFSGPALSGTFRF